MGGENDSFRRTLGERAAVERAHGAVARQLAGAAGDGRRSRDTRSGFPREPWRAWSRSSLARLRGRAWLEPATSSAFWASRRTPMLLWRKPYGSSTPTARVIRWSSPGIRRSSPGGFERSSAARPAWFRTTLGTLRTWASLALARDARLFLGWRRGSRVRGTREATVERKERVPLNRDTPWTYWPAMRLEAAIISGIGCEMPGAMVEFNACLTTEKRIRKHLQNQTEPHPRHQPRSRPSLRTW